MVGVAVPQAVLQNGLINGLMNQMEVMVMINKILEDRLPVIVISQLMSRILTRTRMDTDHTDVDGLTTDENTAHSDVLHGSQTTVVDDNTELKICLSF